MPLYMVATPIGNPQDFSQRAVELLREADLVIGEELKILRQILKSAGVQARAMDQLNEHSRAQDIEHFVAECRSKSVVLVSDCGTPGFCDPGADLVAACRKADIRVHPVPGASSLMALLSVCGYRVEEFLFAGFLTPKAEARKEAWRSLSREPRAVILMETPYRFEKFVQELASNFPDRICVLGLNLTQSSESVVVCKGMELMAQAPKGDHEPIVLIMPKGV